MPLTIDATTTQFITTSDVIRQANIQNPSPADTQELDLYREAAQDVVESIVGPVLWRTVTENLPVLGPDQRLTGLNMLAVGQVSLTYRPVVSITSMTSAGSPGGVTYTLDPTNGILTGVGPWPWVMDRYVTVTYVAGRTSCPAAIRLAALIIAVHNWQTQLGNSAPASQGAFDNDQRLDVAEFMSGYAIPNRAIELLTPFRISPVVVA